MSPRAAQAISLSLLFVGTAATVYYVYSQRRRVSPGSSDRIGRAGQPNRDSTLGKPQPYRKYFGASGPSSAKGSGAAAGLPTAISLLGTPGVQAGQGVTTTDRGNDSTLYRPTAQNYDDAQRALKAYYYALTGNG